MSDVENTEGKNGSPHVADAKVQIGTRLFTPEVAAKVRSAMQQFQAEDAPAEGDAPADPAPAEKPVEKPAEPGTPPPQPGDIPAHVLDAAVRISQGQQALEKQKAEWKEDLARADKVRGAGQKLQTDRLAGIKEVLSHLTNEPVDDVLYAIVEDYTRHVLGVEPSSEQRVTSETAKLRADVQALKREQAEARQKALDEAERGKRDAEEREVLVTVGQFVADSAQKYPYAHALGDDAPGLVWQEIRDEHAKSGQTITLEEATTRVNQTVEKSLNRFQHLFSRQAVPDAKTTATRPTSERPRSVSKDLSSAPASTTSNGKPLTPEEKRAQTLAKVRQIIRSQEG